LPLASKSLDLWERFGVDSGEDTGFHRCGLLYLSNGKAGSSRPAMAPPIQARPVAWPRSAASRLLSFVRWGASSG